MSTIKSSDEHLTLNADGSGKSVKFQANGVEKASISSSGAFTSTTIDATKLTGDLPAISGANLTGVGVAGITSSADATAITIDSSENVGIGTSPSYKLHTLIGSGEASGVGILNTSGQGLNIYTDSTAANADVSIDQGATGAAMIFRQNGTERLRIASDGRGLSGFTAKAWFNLDQTGTQNLRDSHNISSVSDGGTGRTTYSFANNLGSINYSVTLSTNGSANNAYGGSWDNDRQSCMFNLAVGSFSTANAPSGSYLDYDLLCGMVFGD